MSALGLQLPSYMTKCATSPFSTRCQAKAVEGKWLLGSARWPRLQLGLLASHRSPVWGAGRGSEGREEALGAPGTRSGLNSCSSGLHWVWWDTSAGRENSEVMTSWEKCRFLGSLRSTFLGLMVVIGYSAWNQSFSVDWIRGTMIIFHYNSLPLVGGTTFGEIPAHIHLPCAQWVRTSPGRDLPAF